MKVRLQPDDNCDAGRRIAVRIEELILHGFAPADRHRIARAVQKELVKRLRQGGMQDLAKEPSALAHIDGGAFHVPAGEAPWTIGARIGASIYQSLRRQGQPEQSASATRPVIGGLQR